MKRILFLMCCAATLVSGLVLNSCKKASNPSIPSITFSESVGKANTQGEYTLTGTIHSDVKLSKVIITKVGSSTPFITDDTTAKNKIDYNYSYLITGITTDTTLIIDIYDLNGGKNSVKFLIHP